MLVAERRRVALLLGRPADRRVPGELARLVFAPPE